MTPMRVVIESPYAGKSNLPWILGRIVRWLRTLRNVRYAILAMRHSILRHGESPYASHLLYPSRWWACLLDDTIPGERNLGIQAGFAWGKCAEKRVFYVDLGWSAGMKFGLDEAKRLGQPIEFRSMYGLPIMLPDMTKPRRSLDGASDES